jgi:hypothetical protein
VTETPTTRHLQEATDAAVGASARMLAETEGRLAEHDARITALEEHQREQDTRIEAIEAAVRAHFGV